MQDELFGPLKWSFRDCWEGQAAFANLRKFGEALAPGKAAAADADSIDLLIDTPGGRRSKPAAPQHAAWRAVLARADDGQLWNELLDLAFATYQRQWPVRTAIFRRTYGDDGRALLDRLLPPVDHAGDLAPLILPTAFRIRPRPRKVTTPADIDLLVGATWHVDGFAARIRDGRVIEIGPPLQMFETRSALPHDGVEHDVFGRLRRLGAEATPEVIEQCKAERLDPATIAAPRPWVGRMRFDALLGHAAIADRRAAWTRDRDRAEYPASRMAWEFADGEFELFVYTRRGKQPSDVQAMAFEQFRAHQEQLAAELIATVLEQYQQVWQIRRQHFKDRYVEDNIPEPTSTDGLRDLMQLRHVHVHEADKQGVVTIAMQFVCTWDYDGFSAIWRDGKIIEWGEWKDAKPK